MDTNRTRSAGFLWPTVDLLLAVLGIGLVTYPLAAAVHEVLALPVAAPASLTIVVASVGSYPFVAGHWSLGTLGDYVFCWMVAIMGIGAAIFTLAVVVGYAPGDFDHVTAVVVYGLAHLLTAYAVGVADVSPTRLF